MEDWDQSIARFYAIQPCLYHFIKGHVIHSFPKNFSRSWLLGIRWTCFQLNTITVMLYQLRQFSFGCFTKEIRKCPFWPQNDLLWWQNIPFPWSSSICLTDDGRVMDLPSIYLFILLNLHYRWQKQMVLSTQITVFTQNYFCNSYMFPQMIHKLYRNYIREEDVYIQHLHLLLTGGKHLLLW